MDNKQGFFGVKARVQYLQALTALFLTVLFLSAHAHVFEVKVPALLSEVWWTARLISLVVVPAITYWLVRPDPLQSGRPGRLAKKTRFFQEQFPSRWLIARCLRCQETPETCRACLTSRADDASQVWFRIFKDDIGAALPEERERTFRRGYTCKFVWGNEWLLLAFLGLSVLVAAFQRMMEAEEWGGPHQWALTGKQVLFVVGCAAVWTASNLLNRAGKQATGCWKLWREVNRHHTMWMEEHPDVLKQKVCCRLGEDKSFRPKHANE